MTMIEVRMKILIAVILALFLAGCGGTNRLMLRDVSWKWEKGDRYAAAVRGKKYPAEWRVTENSERSKTVVRVTDFDGKQVRGIRLSPDGERLVFAVAGNRDKALNLQVFAAAASNGGALVRVTDTPRRSYAPCFSADGGEIVFCSEIAGVPQLWSVPSSGKDGALRRVTAGKYPEMQPDVSPDGKQVVFVTILPGRQESICIARRDGTGQSYLARGRMPRFSPDGTKIAFAAPGRSEAGEEDKTAQIWTMNLDGGDMKQVTRAEGDCGYPSWSPDGGKIAYASDETANAEDRDAGRNCNIWLIDAAGAETPVLLTENPATDIEPVWSPDGSYLYFCSNRGFNWNVWRIDLLRDETVRPTPPEAVNAEIESGVLTLSWKPSASKVACGYNVYFRPKNRKSFWKLNEEPVKNLSYPVPFLENAGEYLFAVTAAGRSSLVESVFSAEVSGKSRRPAAPQKITASARGDTVTLVWDRQPGAAGYNVYFRPSWNKVPWKINQVPLKDASLKVGGKYLKAGETYAFHITSLDRNNVESEHSSGVTAVIPVTRDAGAPAQARKAAPAKPVPADAAGDWGGDAQNVDWK